MKTRCGSSCRPARMRSRNLRDMICGKEPGALADRDEAVCTAEALAFREDEIEIAPKLAGVERQQPVPLARDPRQNGGRMCDGDEQRGGGEKGADSFAHHFVVETEIRVAHE